MSDYSNLSGFPSALQQAGQTETRFSSETIELQELGAATVLKIHSRGSSAQRGIAPQGLGCELPTNVGGARGEDPAALCPAPAEWLLISTMRTAADLLAEIGVPEMPLETALLDLSDACAVFRLSGRGGGWLLSKLSGLDFHAAPASGQHAARTRMDHLAVVVHYHRAQEPGRETGWVFDLLVDRSLALHFWKLLCAAAPHANELTREFGGME